jgi:hypothetical protein
MGAHPVEWVMASEQRAQYLPENELNAIPDGPRRLIEDELGRAVQTLPWARALVQQGRYARQLVLKLIATARGRSGETWPERRLAIMLLENQLLCLSPGDLAEFDWVFVQLGLKPRLGLDVSLVDFLLHDGYSTLTLRDFTVEFLRRLARLNRVHARLNSRCRQEAWPYLIRTAREMCKWVLGRYLFTPAEVAEEILRHAIVTQGSQHALARVL